jgi:hypothetical protein
MNGVARRGMGFSLRLGVRLISAVSSDVLLEIVATIAAHRRHRKQRRTGIRGRFVAQHTGELSALRILQLREEPCGDI